MLAAHPELFDSVKLIFSGKFRRYHGISWLRQLLDIKTVLLNLRDIIFVLLGTFQSLFELLIHRPDAVFSKGGYVGLPVSLAAVVLRIPLIVHDSDATPGLANRLASRWARVIATGMEPELYPYKPSRMYFVGTPVDDKFRPVSKKQQRVLKMTLKFDPDQPLILITGGSLGAKKLNTAVTKILPRLLKITQCVHIAGRAGYLATEKDRKSLPQDLKGRYRVVDYVGERMYDYVRAADLVITRGGASSMAEIANTHKPSIIIPNPVLTGGHQLKNAKIFSTRGAAMVLDEATLEATPVALLNAVESVLSSKEIRGSLSERIGKMAKPQAAKRLARLIVKTAGQGETESGIQT